MAADSGRRRDAVGYRTGRRLWQSPVTWFDPVLLLRTLFQLVIARLFARHGDPRGRDAGKPLEPPLQYAGEELVLDYVADLGDGFAATATVAALLAQPALNIGGEALPHGRVLVMGGDQVYPAASRDEYLRRLECPYYSLLPESGADAPRDLLVLPGNHDWYDGLAAFSRLFLQQRWFAGWRTRQSRSYFVARLPQRWWLVAVDVQLDNDIDTAQRDYLLAATADIAPGDRVMLVAAVPWWQEPADSRLRRNMAWLEQQLVTARGARTWLSLAGDHHHYLRYEGDDGSQRITAGGGGAFLHGTAWMPRQLAHEDVPARQAQAWPTAAQSRLLLWRLLFFPLRNPAFSLLLGGALTLLLWLADAAAHGTFFHTAAILKANGLGAALPYALANFMGSLPYAPLLALGTAGFVAALVAFVELPPSVPAWAAGWLRGVIGGAHALAHLLLALWLLPQLMPASFELAAPGVYLWLLFKLFLLLGLGSGFLFGLYLWLGWQLAGLHREAAFAAVPVDDFRHFLRLCIRADGSLHVHVVAVRQVCRRWRERTPAHPGEARIEPADGVAIERRAQLLETVVIRPR